MKAVAYIRVSTDSQQESGLGLEAQRQTIQAYCTYKGVEIVSWCEDALSGKNTNRPNLQKALAILKRGEASLLITSKLDRLSRSVMDLLNLAEQAKREGWNICLLDLMIDTTDPTGEVIMTVMAAFSQWERRQIGQRTKDALAVKKSQGVVLGRRSGIDKPTLDYITQVYNEEGSYAKVAKRLNNEGVPTSQGGTEWRAGAIWTVLKGGQDS